MFKGIIQFQNSLHNYLHLNFALHLASYVNLILPHHYIDISWASRHFKSPATRLVFNNLIRLTTKKSRNLHIIGLYPNTTGLVVQNAFPCHDASLLPAFRSCFSLTSYIAGSFWVWARLMRSGGRFNIKVLPYQYRNSHCGDKTILRPSYLHNGISYTGKTAALY